ncbi:MAG: hypothetical protein D6725_09295 [Planctomycetota bacterium]|nr:MAG: hypothetical protein D6725_09295 [Planctomycetota bacterium]
MTAQITPQPAADTLERTFLEIRAKLLELAADLDRIERGAGFEAVRDDERLQNIRKALQVLLEPGTDRAERVQMIFSDPYDPHWAD